MIVLLVAAAFAEIPLPSYRDELVDQRWEEVNGLLTEGCAVDRYPVMCKEGTVDRAIAHAEAFQRSVVRAASLEYLAGLANRYGGRDDEAIRRYQAAIALDANRADAWYDLGEIWMSRGDTAEARRAFEQVRTLRSEGELAWFGPWRLAEVSALEHDPVGLELNIKDALRKGFSFRQIAGQENWRGFYADPALTDTLDKLLTVYADPGVRESLRAAPP